MLFFLVDERINDLGGKVFSITGSLPGIVFLLFVSGSFTVIQLLLNGQFTRIACLSKSKKIKESDSKRIA
jgi:hypothetical protein